MNGILAFLHIVAVLMNGFYLIGATIQSRKSNKLSFKVGAVLQVIVFIYLLILTLVLF